MQDEPAAHYHEIISKASQLMSGYFQQPVHFSKAIQLSEPDRRNVILRLFIDTPTTAMPQSLILKKTVSDKKVFDSDALAETENEQLSRFARDWAGIEFLSNIGTHHAPHFYCGSIEHQFIIIEDLGEPHHSLVGPLTRAPSSINIQEAISALQIYSRRVGQMHADTYGKTIEYKNILEKIYPKAIRPHFIEDKDISTFLTRMKHQVGIDSVALQREIEDIRQVISSDNHFKVYLHGDICPDNVYFHHAEMQIIDFEYGDVGHALMDGVYLRMSMPSCWCAKTVPIDIMKQMEVVYRNELKAKIPAAADEFLYNKSLVYACAFWIVRLINWHINELMDFDMICPSGPVPSDSAWKPEENSFRSRILSRLEAFILCPESEQYLPKFREVCQLLMTHLKRIWPQAKSLDHYPVFEERGKGYERQTWNYLK